MTDNNTGNNDNDWIQALKVGDRVAYGGNSRTTPNYNFSTIKSISSTRAVITLECGLKFNADGRERKKTSQIQLVSSSLQLVPLEEALSAIKKAEEAAKEAEAAMKVQNEKVAVTMERRRLIFQIGNNVKGASLSLEELQLIDKLIGKLKESSLSLENLQQTERLIDKIAEQSNCTSPPNPESV